MIINLAFKPGNAIRASQNLPPQDFKRLFGVKHFTFDVTVEVQQRDQIGAGSLETMYA
jgi:hypothetical protein